MLEYNDYPPAPDVRDPVTGDWLPLSESDKVRMMRQSSQLQKSSSDISSLLTSILK